MVVGILKKKRECVKAFRSQDIIVGFLRMAVLSDGTELLSVTTSCFSWLHILLVRLRRRCVGAGRCDCVQ